MTYGYSFSSFQYTSQNQKHYSQVLVAQFYGYLHQHLHEAWIGSTTSADRAAFLATAIAEPKARSYFLTGLCKGLFLLLLQQGLPELWKRIIAAIVEIDGDVLQRIWPEMDCRLDVRPDTKGIQHLRGKQKNKTLGEFVRPSVGCILQYFQSFKCTDFLKCVREF